ncbi:MAG: prepilin-type N-terminal cleavage/methylation domain-containing protein [Lachnospiraceae bacterium]|nr:prepilin-type N-terminal cleavage/methylation domain-containing protein [Lachnospiraceae bacterium]
MATGAGSDKKAARGEAGFSLIELLVVISVIMTMTGITVMGMGSYRAKITERRTREIADELLLAQNSQQIRPGIFRARLMQEGHDWVIAVERTMDTEQKKDPAWSEFDRKSLGSSNSLRIMAANGKLLQSDSTGTYHEWRFDRETGACTGGAGEILLEGSGKTYRLTVFPVTGRTQIQTVYE